MNLHEHLQLIYMVIGGAITFTVTLVIWAIKEKTKLPHARNGIFTMSELLEHCKTMQEKCPIIYEVRQTKEEIANMNHRLAEVEKRLIKGDEILAHHTRKIDKINFNRMAIVSEALYRFLKKNGEINEE